MPAKTALMASSTLTIDLDAIEQNWRALDALSRCETAAVVKANGYGLGAPSVARKLARAGVRTFFVALAEEGTSLRAALGPGPRIYVLSGHMDGDAKPIQEGHLTPILNSVDQMLRHLEASPGVPFGLQLDTGMNRLGLEPTEWQAVRDIALSQHPTLIMSHLACADEPDHAMNERQRMAFLEMTADVNVPRSLAATGGILLGQDYHFDMVRPGIGLFGGFPYQDAQPVVALEIPVIQVRDVMPGETVGYGNTWEATEPARIATVSGGYADGISRIMGPQAYLYADDAPCKIVGRISMDLIGVDISDLDDEPAHLSLLGPSQSVDQVAEAAGTIGYEILTSLGTRYKRSYRE